jgi:hypothetical protein
MDFSPPSKEIHAERENLLICWQVPLFTMVGCVKYNKMTTNLHKLARRGSVLDHIVKGETLFLSRPIP